MVCANLFFFSNSRRLFQNLRLNEYEEYIIQKQMDSVFQNVRSAHDTCELKTITYELIEI